MYDELELDKLGDRKTALFLIMSDTDSTFNFLISMIYTQLFNLLCDKADDVYGGKLPILKLKRQWERQVSLDYLMNEKFVQFAASEPDEEYPFTVCGQTVLLCNAALADAISVLPEQTREEILRYYFLRQPQRVIGACIGRSRSTAGRHIQLALQRLREEMGVSRYE